VSTELEKADYILLEGGVNDAWNNAKLGALNGSFAPAFYSGDTIGTLEAMLDYLAKKRSDKRVAYVFPHGGLFASSEKLRRPGQESMPAMPLCPPLQPLQQCCDGLHVKPLVAGLVGGVCHQSCTCRSAR